MRSRFRPSAAMVVACIALFVALGGTATAVTYVVSSNSQIGPNTISGHKPPTGKHSNVIAGSINGQDVADNSVRGADVVESSLGEVPSATVGGLGGRPGTDYPATRRARRSPVPVHPLRSTFPPPRASW